MKKVRHRLAKSSRRRPPQPKSARNLYELSCNLLSLDRSKNTVVFRTGNAVQIARRAILRSKLRPASFGTGTQDADGVAPEGGIELVHCPLGLSAPLSLLRRCASSRPEERHGMSCP